MQKNFLIYIMLVFEMRQNRYLGLIKSNSKSSHLLFTDKNGSTTGIQGALPPEYSFQTQIWLVFALIGLHKFIKDYLCREPDYFEEEVAITHQDTIADSGSLRNSLTISTIMNEKRDRISNEIWIDYVDILAQRGRII